LLLGWLPLGAALNFCEISGFGAAAAGLDEALKAKLNFEGELLCAAGPVGGGRLGGAMDLPSPEDGSGSGAVSS
jgi:hypothetical protein